MSYPDLWTALQDPDWSTGFSNWARRTKNTDYGDEQGLLSAVREFTANPILAGANQVIRTYIGFPETGWVSLTDMPLPDNVRQAVTAAVRTNLDGQEMEESELGGVAVPPEAFDPAVAHVSEVLEGAYHEFLNSYEPSDAEYAAMHERNQSNIKATDDGEMVTFVQVNYLVLVGDGHDPWLTAYARAAATSVGSIKVEKGGVFSAGKLQVWGCTQPDQFRWAIEQISDKTVEFRS